MAPLFRSLLAHLTMFVLFTAMVWGISFFTLAALRYP